MIDLLQTVAILALIVWCAAMLIQIRILNRRPIAKIVSPAPLQRLPVSCFAESSTGYLCCLPGGHKGEHEATVHGMVVQRWR